MGVAPFAIHDTEVAPGSCANIHIALSRQVTGLESALDLRVAHGARPGPSIFVSGAIHGDEIIGTAIIRELIARIEPAQLAGTVIFAPAVNIFGFVQHSRYLPDRRDLNRSFPGYEHGSLAAQLAHRFTTEVIERCSLGIDLHSAAIHRYNLPQIRIAAGDDELVELAIAFGAPIIIESPLRDGSMRELALQRNTKMLLFEAGEALRFDRLSITHGVAGILRVMSHLEMIAMPDALHAPKVPLRANRSTWVRSPRGGVSKRLKRSGDFVTEGDCLAEVGGLFGEDSRQVFATATGLIIGHATLPVVHQGDAMFHIAELDPAGHAGEDVATIAQAIRASEPGSAMTPMLDEDEVI